MPAAADPDAVSFCLLPDAQRRDGSAACALAVDSRPFGARSVAHTAGCDHHHDVFHAAHDAAGLGLYWSAGQLIGIVQQSVMNRTSLGREMREMMEKRARKKEK